MEYEPEDITKASKSFIRYCEFINKHIPEKMDTTLVRKAMDCYLKQMKANEALEIVKKFVDVAEQS